MKMNTAIKLLLVADGHGTIHSESIRKYLSKKNYQIKKIFWKNFYHKNLYQNKNKFSIFFYLSKIDNHLIFGPITLLINLTFIFNSIINRHDVIFFHRSTHISHLSIFIIKKTTSSIFISYNNDDPFSKKAKKKLWNNYIKSIRYMDHCFVYREKNITEHLKFGCANSSLLRSYFIPDLNYDIPRNNVPLKYRYDVIFAGHFENDQRDLTLLFLLKKGINLRIYGSNWNKSIYYNEFLKFMPEIEELNPNDYNLALNGSKIALIFLSKLNNDTYTRRCFEIPCAKSLIISEQSSDMKNNIFTNNSCIYFNSNDALLNKISYYLKNHNERNLLANNAYNIIKNKHSIVNRVETINNTILNILNTKT